MKLRSLAATLVLSFLLLTAWAADAQVYFSRSDPVASVLAREINAAHKSIQVLMYSFTDRTLADALVAAAARGVEVRLVFDRTQASERNSLTDELLEKLGPRRVVYRTGRGRGVMHQKLAIFDGLTVALGSYNWTNNARLNNWENLIVLRDAQIAAECVEEFTRVWEAPAPATQSKQAESKK